MTEPTPCAMSLTYRGTTVRLRGQSFLAAYQEIFRVGGLVLAGLILSTFLGMVLARGTIRLGVWIIREVCTSIWRCLHC